MENVENPTVGIENPTPGISSTEILIQLSLFLAALYIGWSQFDFVVTPTGVN